jgi:hypothetical protein
MFNCVRDAKLLHTNPQGLSAILSPQEAVAIKPIITAFEILLDIFFAHSNVDEIFQFVTKIINLFELPRESSLRKTRQCCEIRVAKYLKDSRRHSDVVRFSIKHLSDVIMNM